MTTAAYPGVAYPGDTYPGDSTGSGGGGAPVTTDFGIPVPILDIGFASGAQTLPYWHVGDPVRGVVGTAVVGSSATPFVEIPLSRLVTFTIDRGAQRIDSPLIRYDAGVATIVLTDPNSEFDPDNLLGPYVSAGVSQVTPMVPIRLRVRFGTDVYPLFDGFADSWNLSYTSPLDTQVTIRATDAFKIFQDPRGRTVLGAPAGAGETTGARINRVLDSVGWGANDRDIDTGDQTVQATTFEGSALDEMYLTADSELGEMYVQPDGKVRFRARSAIRTATRSVTSQAVFGNWQHVGDGELPYKERTLDYGEGRIANQVLATNVDGTEQSKSDVASQTRYGVKSFSRADLILQTDADALMWAGLLLYQSKDLEQWFTSLDVDPRALGGSLYPQVFGREIGDRITVLRRPLVGTSPITRDCFIRGISHSFGPGPNRWATKWSLQSATRYTFFTVGDPTRGVVGAYGIA